MQMRFSALCALFFAVSMTLAGDTITTKPPLQGEALKGSLWSLQLQLESETFAGLGFYFDGHNPETGAANGKYVVGREMLGRWEGTVKNGLLHINETKPTKGPNFTAKVALTRDAGGKILSPGHGWWMVEKNGAKRQFSLVNATMKPTGKPLERLAPEDLAKGLTDRKFRLEIDGKDAGILQFIKLDGTTTEAKVVVGKKELKLTGALQGTIMGLSWVDQPNTPRSFAVFHKIDSKWGAIGLHDRREEEAVKQLLILREAN